MKIIHVIPTLVSGGAERIVVDICNELSINNEVYLIQLSSNDEQKFSFYKNQLSKEITYFNLKGQIGKLFSLKTFKQYLKIVNEIKPHVIHAHINISYSFIPAIFLPKIKYYYTIHNAADKECLVLKGFSLRKVIRFFYKNDLILPITISFESRNSYEDFFKLNNSILIENGCYKKIATNQLTKVKQEIEHLKTDRKDIVFLSIGRCVPQKNYEMLINVFNTLIREKYRVKLVIIGDGFFSNEGNLLQNKAEKGIYFLGTKENVSDYFYACNAFCLSSLWEGLPITILEAISVGCVPICTPAGGIPNVVLDERIGFLSKDFTEKEYLYVVKKYLKEIDNIDKEFIRNYFDENYNISKTVSSLLNQYAN